MGRDGGVAVSALPLVMPRRASDLLIEPCAGSAALSLHLLGARAGLMPYQGSKWRLRHEITAVLREAGALGRPRRLVLTDAGPWGWVWRLLMSGWARPAVLEELARLDAEEPRAAYERLQGAIYRKTPKAAAEFLFLQRLAFCGKAVSGKGWTWRSPGFNPVSAYGVEGTDRFGEVKPQGPTLISRVSSLPWVDVLDEDPGGPAVVFLDPPYADTTGYPDGDMPRAEVVALALRHAGQGRAVFVAEAEPVAELVALGWRATELTPGVEGRFGNQDEWLTWRAA